MKKIFRHTAVAAVLSVAAMMSLPSSVTATSYQDWWNNTDLSGMGINIGQQGNDVFVSWYMYDENQNPSFLLFFGELQNGNSLTAPLRRFYGPEPPVYDEQLWEGEIVGTATISFISPTQANFSYDYDGKEGSFKINRYTFQNIDISALYTGASIYTVSNCGDSNGNYYFPDFYEVSHQDDYVMLQAIDEGCIYEGPVQQHGTHFTGSGTFSCINGNTGTWTSPDIHVVEFGMIFNYSATISNGCQINGRAGGMKYQTP